MDQKRLFMAIAISVAILLGFQLLIAPHLPQPPKPPPQVASSQTTPPVHAGAGSPAPARRGSGDADGAQGGAAGADRGAAPAAARSACWARGSTTWCSTDYRETLAAQLAERAAAGAAVGDRSPTTCSTAGAPAPGEQVKLPDNDTLWTSSGGTLSAGHPVTLSWDNGAGLTFQITLSVDDDYMFSVQQSVKNATGAPVKLFPWARIRRDYTPRGGRLLHPVRGPARRGGRHAAGDAPTPRRRARARRRTASPTSATGDRRLGRHHRQILARPRWCRTRRSPRRSTSATSTENGDHYQVDYVAQEPQTVAAERRGVDVSSHAVRRRQDRAPARPLRGRGPHPAASTRRWISAGSIS